MQTLEVGGVRGVGAGRLVTTTTSLQPGQVVLREPPLVTGPRVSSVLVCVSCLSRLGGSAPSCSSCGLPLCPPCQGAPGRHSQECRIFTSNKLQFSFQTQSQAKIISPLVTIVRLLLADKWRHLESNLEKRRGSKSWNYVEKHIVPVLTTLRDQNGNNIFEKEDIHLAAGVLDTNCFEIKTEDKFGRSLFLTAAMFNNNCYPNCVRRITEGNIEIINVRSVPAGEELTICYTDVLMPTPARQETFLSSKHFTCQCSRCSQTIADCVRGPRWPASGTDSPGEERSDCAAVTRLLSLPPPHNQMVLQWSSEILQHAASCRHCRQTAGLELTKIRQSLLWTCLDLETLQLYK